MKRYRLAFVLTIILAVMALILILNNRSNTLLTQENYFAVSDTSNITKLFLADKNNNKVKLEKTGADSWKLNEKYDASGEAIRTLLKTLLLIEIKTPVVKAARNNIIRLMAGKSVKMEVYQRVYRIDLFGWIRLFPHEKCTRTYYVGDPTMDNRGTYMLMEGSEQPYVVYIPNFRGFVAARYSAFENDWRMHTIFSCRLPDIKSVSVTFSEKPEYSFSITNNENRNFTLSSPSDQRPVLNYDTLKVIQYLGSFHNVNFESFLNDLDKRQQDSIKGLTPTYIITLVDKAGKTNTLKAWRRKALEGEVDLEGTPTIWDRDRMYAELVTTGDFVSIQYFVFDRILAPITWFRNE